MYYVFPYGTNYHTIKANCTYIVFDTKTNTIEKLKGCKIIEYASSKLRSELSRYINLFWLNNTEVMLYSGYTQDVLSADGKFLFMQNEQVGACAWYDGCGIIVDNRYVYELLLNPIRFRNFKEQRVVYCSFTDFKRLACLELI